MTRFIRVGGLYCPLQRLESGERFIWETDQFGLCVDFQEGFTEERACFLIGEKKWWFNQPTDSSMGLRRNSKEMDRHRWTAFFKRAK